MTVKRFTFTSDELLSLTILVNGLDAADYASAETRSLIEKCKAMREYFRENPHSEIELSVVQ